MSVAASRRWCQVFCMLLAVGLVARIGLGLALPWLLDRAARAAGCTLRCQATSLSLLGASFEVRGLALRAGAAPLAGCAVARADVDVSALCRGELRVHEVAVDGAEIWLQRGADGRWNWPRSAAAPEAVATTPAPTVAPQPVVLDFGLPASVGVLRLGALRVHLDDAATVPRFVGLLTGDLTVFELGNRERPARLAAEFAVAEVLDALRVEGTWRGGLRTAELDLRLTVRGARPQACRGYLEPAGVVPAAERIDLRAALALQLRPRRDDPAGAFGELRVSAAVTVDSSEHLACDAIAVDLGHVDRRRCDVAQVTVTGVRGRAARRTDGGLRVLGVDLPAPTSAGVPAAPPPPSAPAAGLQLRVARAAVRDVAIAWADAAVSPPAQLAVELAQLEATELLPAPGRTTRAELELRVPQVMDKLEVRATWTPAAPGRTGADGACELQASGVTLRAVRPYLTAAGIEPVLNSGGFAAALRTHLDGDHFAVELGPVRLTDGAQEWLALDALAVRGDTSAGGAPHLGKVELRGLRAAVERTAAGALRVGGLALVPLPSAMPAPAPAPPSTDAPPGLRLDDLIVAGVALRWRDALVLDEQGQPTELALDDLTATVRSFELGAGLPRCAHAEVRVRSAALADTIAFTAAARTAEAPNRAQATVQLEAVRLGALRGYLRAAGLEPEARQWTAGLSLRADCDPAAPNRIDVELRDLAVAADGAPALAVRSASLNALEWAPILRAATFTVVGPEVTAARGADGALRLAGLRVSAATPPPPVTPAAPTAAAPAAGAALGLGQFALEAGVLRWSDAAVAPPLALGVGLALSSEAIDLGPDGLRAPLRARAELTMLPDLGRVAADVEVGDRTANGVVGANLRIAGLQFAPLQAYLPPGLQGEPEPHDGHLELRFTPAAADAPAGALALDVPRLRWGRVGAGDAALALADSRLQLARADAGGYHVQLAALRGLQVEVTKVDDGWSIGGLRLLDTSAEVAPPAAQPVEPPVEPPIEPPAAPTFPELTVDRLSVALERLQVNDATSAARPPLRVALQLDHASPLVLRAGEVDGLAPWAFTLRGRVEPLIDALALDLGVTPWGAEPQLTLALRLHGVQPEGLAAWVPALRERVEVAKSEVSELAADLAVHLRLGRGGLLDFQPADGFGAEIELRDLVLQPVGGTSPSFGIEDVRVDVRRFAPRTGDLHIAAVEIENLRGRVEELAEGTKLGGLVLRRTPAESAPAPAPPADAIRATPPAAGVVRVDTVSISGLDFLYRDERRQPPVDLPLTGLEVDVRALAIPPSPSVPLMFQASVNAGNVALRERAKSSSVVHGLLGAVAGAVTGSADEFQTEQRAVFEELALQGRLLLGAQPEGQVRLDLGSLELPALAPFVSGSGVVIGDGLLDSGVTLRFDGRGNLGIDSRFDFTHLSVSEPANGPISTYLKLPAPLDSVLFALKNEADEHKVPLAFDIGAEGVSTAQLAMSATGALGQLIARAIAGAPLRAAGMVTGLFGVGAGEIATPAAPAAVPFLPGEAVATNELDERLAEALAQLAALDGGALVLVHELGVGDVAPVSRLANPSAADVLAVVARLRARVAELDQQLDARAAALRARLGVGATVEVALGEARRLHAERAQLDQALANALDLLRPGAERRAGARTRHAARSLGDLRLAAVRARLLERDPSLVERIEVRRAKPDAVAELSGGGVVRVLARPRTGQ